MTNFGLSWKEVTTEISFKNLMLLSASVPPFKTSKEDDKKVPIEGEIKGGHMFDILGRAEKMQKKRENS